MSLPRYEKYKESGVSWVGAIPNHWTLLRTKTLFELKKRPPREEDGVVTAFRDGEVTLRSNRRTEGFTNSLQEIGYQGVRQGDLVIHAMDAFAGAIGVSDSDGKSTPVYSVCEPKHGLSNSRYYARLLRYMALSGFIESLAKGIRERSTEFRWAEAGNVYLPVPPIDEQTTIAAFLDRETAKIDTLIAEQEKLITLLAEKRQATISHAVTKGLNANAPEKDSGIAWVGSVPAHWHIAKLGLFATIENGTTPSRAAPEYWEGGDIPWLASGEVNQLKITTASEFITAAALDSCSLRLLPVGTVVVGMIGQGKTRGMSAVLCIPATINQNLAAICPGSGIESLYILYVLHAVYEWLREAGRGGNQAAMNCEILSALRVPIPPLTEQRTIVDFIETEAAKLDSLKVEAERAIALLKERRSAVIAAAVTGQIDVRCFEVQNEATLEALAA